MSSKKFPEMPKDAAECILRTGKTNNVVVWRENMQTQVTMLYGMTGTFFTTNKRYVQPIPREEDYIPQIPEPEDGEAPVGPISASLTSKLREGAFEGRRKAVERQRSDERTIWPFMWSRMSPASQSKVREDPDFEDAYLNLDCVRLWDFIRRSHLTHIYGEGDPMRELNIQEQENKYHDLRQDEREFIAGFKLRFDNQLKANEGAGVTMISDSKKAIDFLGKLDQRRYGSMTSQMKNDALRNVGDAFPKTLSEAYRIASNWLTDHPVSVPKGVFRGHENAVFLADTVTSCRPEAHANQKSNYPPRVPRKFTPPGLNCFVCGLPGHKARECGKRKGDDTAMLAQSTAEEWDPVYLSRSVKETALFTKYDILLDNEASLNIFANKELLTNVKASSRRITMTGVDATSPGVKVDQEGIFHDVGHVYYSPFANANILSFATQVDNGATIRYDSIKDIFEMTPRNSNNTYVFARKATTQSDGRLYSCDVRTMIISRDKVNLTTVATNLAHFTHREIAAADRARELLARMSFPSVADAKHMTATATGFDITAKDFDRAQTIYGPDIATMKGKSTKPVGFIPDMSDARIDVSHPTQTLSIDIMFIDKIPSLVAVSSPLDLTLVFNLKSLDLQKPGRSASTVQTGIESFITALATNNYVVNLIRCDGEGALAKLKPYLNTIHIEVDVCAAGSHIPIIERRIRVIKERVRSHMAGHLPYALSNTGLNMLILYCVSRLNYMPSNRTDRVSPRELLTGRKATHRDFRCAFGDYVQAVTPTTDNSMSARTDDCIVMLPTGNRTGSVKMLSLSTGQIVTRDHFTILPIPATAIKRMNDLALKDGRTLQRPRVVEDASEPISLGVSVDVEPLEQVVQSEEAIASATEEQLEQLEQPSEEAISSAAEEQQPLVEAAAEEQLEQPLVETTVHSEEITESASEWETDDHTAAERETQEHSIRGGTEVQREEETRGAGSATEDSSTTDATSDHTHSDTSGDLDVDVINKSQVYRARRGFCIKFVVVS